MIATADTGWVLALFLVATRVAGVLLFAPILGFATLPARIRLMFVLVLAATLLMTLPSAPAAPTSAGPLALAVMHELLLGSAMGFGIVATFGAFMLGGRLLDYQMGFGIASLFDPATHVRSPMMGTIFTMLGGVLFLALDAHHTLIRALAFSLTAVPPGELRIPDARLLLEQFGLLFTYGLVLVAPAVMALTLVDIAVAFSARLMPQVSAYFVALPVKVFLGLFVTALSLRLMTPYIGGMYDSIFRHWHGLLA